MQRNRKQYQRLEVLSNQFRLFIFMCYSAFRIYIIHFIGMNTGSSEEVQNYIFAILKSVGHLISNEIKDQLIKVDPKITIRQLIAKIKQQLNLSPNDSLFLYAYGCILNGEETLGSVNKKFQHKLGKSGGKLEIYCSEMATFGACK